MNPENHVETEEFLQETLEIYSNQINQYLVRRETFSMVAGLEFFGDYYDYGRGPKYIPKHNSYVPAPTILPIPKFYG